MPMNFLGLLHALKSCRRDDPKSHRETSQFIITFIVSVTQKSSNRDGKINYCLTSLMKDKKNGDMLAKLMLEKGRSTWSLQTLFHLSLLLFQFSLLLFLPSSFLLKILLISRDAVQVLPLPQR